MFNLCIPVILILTERNKLHSTAGGEASTWIFSELPGTIMVMMGYNGKV